MVAKDDLYQLIRSLTTSEKRYFKVFASRHTSAEEHNLNDLFDEIDRLDEYDEDKLKKRLSKKKENRSVVKYLSAEKKALQDLIMRAMRSYHGEKTVDVQLHELMMDEMFYHGKSLYELQSKTLYKAKKLAEEYEKFPALLTLLQREASMLVERKIKDYDEILIKVLKEESIIIEKISNSYDYRCIDNEFFLNYRSGVNLRDEDVIKAIEKSIKSPLMQNVELAQSFHALRSFYGIHALYYRLRMDFQKSWEYRGKMVQLYKDNSKIAEELSAEYKTTLSNYLNACHTIQKYDEFESVIKEIKSLPSRSLNEDGEVFQNVYFLELLFYMNNNQFDKAVQLVPDIEKGMEVYSSKINKARELSFYYNISVLFFIREEWKESLIWVNKIMDDKSESRRDIQNFIRVLQLILHYELGKSDLLEYTSRSVYRYLLKEKSLHSFERIIMNYVNKLPFKQDDKALLISFQGLKNQIEEVKKNPSEKVVLGMEEMLLWLKSKLIKKKLFEVVKGD